MKKTFTLLLATILSSILGFSQVPDAFNYQAVVRNSSGEVVSNQNVSFKISILEDSESGTAVYSETHTTTTNNFGLANFKIGKGTVESGTFTPDGWGSAPHFIKIELDTEGGSAYTEMGTSQLLSVPYAFHAQTVEVDNVDDADADASNELQTISLSGTQLTLSNNGGTVTLPSSGDGGDNWGTQTVTSDATLTGNGTSASPLSVDGDLTDDQSLSISGNDLSISGGNTVTLPTSSTPWEDADNGITYQSGHVGIGDGPTSSSSLRVANYNNGISMFAINNSEGNATIQLLNQNAYGQSAHFRSPIKITDGSQGSGKVLTSDAEGIASWQDLPSGSSLWSEDNSNIYYSGGKVAVGTLDAGRFQDFQVIKEDEVGVLIKSQTSAATLEIDRPNTNSSSQIMFSTGGGRQFRVGMLYGKSSFRITTDNYSLNGLEIEEDGDVNISDELHSANTGNANMMPFAYGYVSSTGSLSSATSNIETVSKLLTGQYKVEISDLGSDYVVQVTGVGGSSFYLTKLMGMTSTYFTVSVWDTKDDKYIDGNFSFVVYKQ